MSHVPSGVIGGRVAPLPMSRPSVQGVGGIDKNCQRSIASASHTSVRAIFFVEGFKVLEDDFALRVQDASFHSLIAGTSLARGPCTRYWNRSRTSTSQAPLYPVQTPRYSNPRWVTRAAQCWRISFRDRTVWRDPYRPLRRDIADKYHSRSG
jgi:hypothetical protein